MGNLPYYVHIPGLPSRWGVLDVGKKCVHSCSWCYYLWLPNPDGSAPEHPGQGMHREKFRDTDQLIAQVEKMAENGFIGFDITGGEPALFKGMTKVLSRAYELGLASRMITLGQFIGNGKLDEFMSSGLTDFLFSYHHHDPDVFKQMTGGDLSKLTDAMDHLDGESISYGTNTIITTQNYTALPAIAHSISGHHVYVANFIFHNAYYEWAGKADDIQVKYSLAAPYLREAVRILENANIAVNVRYAPLCTIAGLEKNHVGITGVHFDPHEWINTVEHHGMGDSERESHFLPVQKGGASACGYLLAEKEGGPAIGRGTSQGLSKVFAPKCQNCSALGVCDGIDPNYLGRNGDSEFVPYVNDQRQLEQGVLDKDRMRYRPAHVVKLHGETFINPSRPCRGPHWNPLVSVVVANFNHADEIERCIRSLDAQTYRNIEIIVVDDCSTDNSMKVLTALDIEMTIIESAVNSGKPATPRNVGFSWSKGELFMTLDPDDWLEPSCIEELVNALRDNPDCDIAYPGLQTFGDEEVHWVAHPFNREQEIFGNFIPVMSLYSRFIWGQIGYDESDELKGCEDWAQWVGAMALGVKAVPVPRQLVHYCRSNTGIFETEVKPNLEKKFWHIVNKYPEIYPLDIALKARTMKDG